MNFPHGERRIIETTDPTLIALRDQIRRMLDVPMFDGETFEDWKTGRANNLAQAITNEFFIEKRPYERIEP